MHITGIFICCKPLKLHITFVFSKFHTKPQTGPHPSLVYWGTFFVKGLHFIYCKIITIRSVHFHTLHFIYSKGCSGDYFHPLLCKLCKSRMPIGDTSNPADQYMAVQLVGWRNQYASIS